MTAEIWTTTTVAIKTKGGTFYQGVSYVGEGSGFRMGLPRKPEITFRGRRRRIAGIAFEEARNRTIHHNVFHDGSADAERVAHLHVGLCPER